MNAIIRLEKAGLSIPEIASALEVTEHSVRNYRTGRRFPKSAHYRRLIELGEERGLLFTADDFIASDDRAA